MSPRFAYVYFMKDDPDRVRATVPTHISHWQTLRLDRYLGGPFEDRSGGLITFESDDEEQAQSAVDADPFVRDGLLEAYWLKRWTPE
ncbi:MAG: YciI family protein [Gaiellaceae bacterium]